MTSHLAKLSPSRIVYEASGAPKVDGVAPHGGPCFVCGRVTGNAIELTDWLSTNYTDQNRARCPTSQHVCDACVFVHSRKSPVPGRPPKEGKKFGGNFRNYSHLWEYGAAPEYINASKGEKPAILEFLSRKHEGPWFASLADSGQKHVIPFTPINGPGVAGVVQFDDVVIRVPGDQSVVTTIADLLTAGATKAEVESGSYRAETFIRCGEHIRLVEPVIRQERGSAWFTLALWLAQRDEEAVSERQKREKEEKNAKRKAKGKAKKPNRRSCAAVQRSVPKDPTSQCAEALEPTGSKGKSSSENVRKRGSVGDQVAKRPADRKPWQGRLPGFD